MLSLRSLLVIGVTVVSGVKAITPGFPYGSQKVRGVNIGGWLVTEVRVYSSNPIPPARPDAFSALDHTLPLRQDR